MGFLSVGKWARERRYSETMTTENIKDGGRKGLPHQQKGADITNSFRPKEIPADSRLYGKKDEECVSSLSRPVQKE